MNQPASEAAWQIQTLADSARQLAERGDLHEAEKIYRQILEAAPYHVRALNFLAVQALGRGELNQSQAYLEQALRAAPDRAILHQNLGLVLKERGDLQQALTCLDRALALKPDHKTAAMHKGVVLEELGRKDEALAAYWQAWRQFPNPDAVLRNDDASSPTRRLVMHAAASLSKAQLMLIEAELAPVLERHGPEALVRVREAAEIYAGIRPPQHQHSLQQPAYIYMPGVPPRAFFDRTEFPWVPELEAATGAIRQELEAAMVSGQGMAPYVQIPQGTPPQQWAALNGSAAWTSFHIYKAGQRVEANAARCPATLKALAAVPSPAIPGHAPEALFSILQPGAHIPPHFGLANYKLVVHLPLIVPPDCAIRVGHETRGWKEGECLIFDDSFQHEAWNRSPDTRAVLILDLWNPAVTAAEREGITALVAGITAFNRSYGGAT
ncbi:MAG TPA: aspartyl/asparaginyl beta-hydroxylase domain-containing protein [Gammaproteobacteria bacterium]